MEEMKIKGLKIQAKPHTFKVIDSYKITNLEKIEMILFEFLERTEEYQTERPLGSLVNEWVAHNILYQQGLFKKSTRDSDFESKINPIVDFIYKIISRSFIRKSNRKARKRVKRLLKADKLWNDLLAEYIEGLKEIYNDFAEYYWDMILSTEQKEKTYNTLEKIIKNKIFNSNEVSNAERIIHFPLDEKEKQMITDSRRIEYDFFNTFKPYWGYWSNPDRIGNEDWLPYICICGLFIIAHAIMIGWPVEEVYNIYYLPEIHTKVTDIRQLKYLEDIIYEGAKYYG